MTPLILLVDSSRVSILFQETVLRRRDSEIISALSGTEALLKMKEKRPRLVIFAYDLFDMTGPELCRAIRDDEEIRSTSLLFVADSESQSSEHVDLCMAAGCNDIVFRPLQRRDLDFKIEKLTAIPVRKQIRTLTRVEVKIQDGGFFILGHSINLSATGMLLQAEHLLPQNADLRVHFYLPGEPLALNFRAEIVRAEYTASHPRYGLKFVEISEEEKVRLEQLVRRIRSRESL